MRFKTQFRLSTLFLLIAVCAGLLGISSWYFWWVPNQNIKEVLSSLDRATQVSVRLQTYPLKSSEVHSYSVYSGGGRNLTHLFDLDVRPIVDDDERDYVIIRTSKAAQTLVPGSPGADQVLKGIRRAQPAGVPPPDVEPNRAWIDQLILDLEHRLEV